MSLLFIYVFVDGDRSLSRILVDLIGDTFIFFVFLNSGFCKLKRRKSILF